MAVERHFIPLANLPGVQVKDNGQGIKFVKAGSNVPVFDVGKTAQMNNEIGPPTLASQFITCPLDVPVGQTETFTCIPKTRARLHLWSRELTWRAYVSDSHNISITFLLRIQNANESDRSYSSQAHSCRIARPGPKTFSSHGQLATMRECIRVVSQLNSIFYRFGVVCLRHKQCAIRRSAAIGISLLTFIPLAIRLGAQIKSDSTVEFKRLAAELSTARLDGAAESELPQEKALGILDDLASSVLSSSALPDLDAANRRLASLVSHVPPVGENYRLVQLGGSPAIYAMVVNFGLGGPAAVRIYSSASGRYALAARIDHFVEKDFFDSDIELIPMSTAESVFVIVAGRTDDLATGMFTAWRFDGRRAAPLWSSDLLQQSSYEADAEGFHLTYCSEPDEDHPAQCLKMTRDLYRLQAGEWKRIETKDLGPAKPATK
jgi:hypothetical protein